MSEHAETTPDIVESMDALQASELRYRRLFETAQDGILILDADTGVIVDANPFIMSMLDYSLADFVGKELWEIGLFKDIDAAREAFLELQAVGYIRYDDLPLRTSSGRQIAVEFVSNRYQVGKSSVIQCNIRETTKRKQTEDSLRKSERLIRNLVELLPHRIIVKDRNSKTLFCNSNYARDVGLPVEEIIGKDAFAFHPPELAEAYHRDDQRVISTGVTIDVEEVYRVGDDDIWIHTLKVPYRDETGENIGVLVVFEEITERKELEAKLRQSQKLEGIGQLAGGVAHDFNNLLTVILGHCELMTRVLDPRDPLASNVEEIRKCGDRAAVLTRQLLAFSRRQVLQVKVLDLNALVTGLNKMLQRLIGETVDLQLALAPALSSIKADPGQIEQVIMNLVVNARDAMHDGGKLTIETSDVVLDAEYAAHHVAVSPGAHVLLAVTDSGCGMDSATANRIFEPFFTTKPAGKGTGLGLSTVYGIVKQSGGSIWCYSELGQGTTFKIYFPVVAEQAVTVRPEKPSPVAGGTETVLVAEDDASVRSLIEQILAADGYSVIAAANGAEALVEYKSRGADIDLVITDLVMPDMGGKELEKRLIEIQPDVKMLFMSGYAGDAATRHGMIDEGTNFMQKPFSRDALSRKVRELLDR
jgi:two-component system cell cycle sensor histidine kinase/response regulator CckA